MLKQLEQIGERIISAVDKGVVAYVNELYQSNILAPLREPALTDDELIAVRQLIEDRWPLGEYEQIEHFSTEGKSWLTPDFDLAAVLEEHRAQIREYAANTATPFDSADDDARNGTGGGTAETGPTPASNGVPMGCHSPGVGPLNADELHYAAGAIRAWINGMSTEYFSASYFAALADRLSNAALELTPVSH